jgi:hypothetical protein
MTILKPSREIDFLKLGTIKKHKKMIKKKIILLILNDDITFKGVVS